jgi:single-stranded-DNA-specific exonuclease
MPSVWKPKHQPDNGFESPASGVVPPLIDQILRGRGFQTAAQQEKLFSPKLAELQSPFLMKSMREASHRMVEAFRKQESICIYADFDLDGTSGCALLKTGLMGLGFKNVMHYQPQRLAEGYGFHASAVEELSEKKVSLIITVDVGITSYAACSRAKELGVDVILTDHHQPVSGKNGLPEALVIVNPNQKECTSGLGYLCGAGVAFYLLRAVKRALVDAGLISDAQFDLRSVLDFLAIATLTDMVPLRGDNRALTKAGLVELEKTQKPGLRTLLDKLGLADRPLTSQDVAIRFAPKLNALSRMEMGIRPLDIYLIEDTKLAKSLIGDVMENNQNRVQLQSEGETRAMEMLAGWHEKNFVCLIHESFHRGVVGLIATRIAGQTGLPTFIGAISVEGPVVGSARLPAGSEYNLVSSLERAGNVLQRFGGHPQAAGFELYSADAVDQMIAGLKTYFDDDQRETQPKEIHYDADIAAREITEPLLKWFDALGPFGQSFEVPLLRIQNLRVENKKTLKGEHLKFTLQCPETQKLFEALWFSPPKVESINEGDFVQALVELQWNYFGGRTKMQLLIREMKRQYGA